MYMMYVDESGDTGTANSPTDFFALTGIVVHERQWRSFMSTLIAFKKTMRAVHGLPIRAEIHASEFIKSKVFGLQRHTRLAILRNALDELAKIQDISITGVVVDKRNKPPGFDVFDFAWKTLFQRFENTLMFGNFPGGFRSDYGVVFTDDTAGLKLLRMVRRMAVYNPVPSSFGGPPRNLPILRLIEDPHGKDSAESLAIQMADVCAYFLHQRYKPNSYIRRQKAAFYYDRLLPVLNVNASRSSPLGIVEL
jgi:hypothetical protein